MLSLIWFSVVLGFVALLAPGSHQRVLAEDLPPADLPIEGVELVEAKLEDGKLILKKPINQVGYKLVEKEVEKRDGKKVIESYYVPESGKLLTYTREYDLKKVKVTDVDSKPIPTDKLKERLKELTPSVVSVTPITMKYRKLFKDNTVFLEIPPQDFPPPSPLSPPPQIGPEKR